MSVLGFRITRRVLFLVLAAFVLYTLVKRRGGLGRVFPSFTFRQRTEP
ncbi:MAG TPA: hypothetical protein VIM33_04880 [Gaiellaceae bacterium]|jgi:hypothetical protein